MLGAVAVHWARTRARRPPCLRRIRWARPSSVDGTEEIRGALGEQERASCAFVGRAGEHLRALMSRGLADVSLAVLMLDGIELKAIARSALLRQR